jgi:hypothetical protein
MTSETAPGLRCAARVRRAVASRLRPAAHTRVSASRSVAAPALTVGRCRPSSPGVRAGMVASRDATTAMFECSSVMPAKMAVIHDRDAARDVSGVMKHYDSAGATARGGCRGSDLHCAGRCGSHTGSHAAKPHPKPP